jgi:hypothetical protein
MPDGETVKEKPAMLAFSLEQVQGMAERILASTPDVIVAYRLLHEVLRLPPGDRELQRVKRATLNSKWVHQLEAAQNPEGSFGRFHTQDTKVKAVFRTTEEAIDRSLALGLDVGDGVVAKVRDYIEDVLKGKRHISDWREKNDAFPVLIQLILAGRLAQIDPENALLSMFWVYTEEVAERAFARGLHDLEAETTAYLDLSGIHVKRGFLHSQHALWILSSRQLPEWIDAALVDWIWHKPGGIAYLGATLAEPNHRQIWYWLRSMHLLSRFSGWRAAASGGLNWLWSQRNDDGWWDFKGIPARSVDYPLSESWRRAAARTQDTSTSILTLLRKSFD